MLDINSAINVNITLQEPHFYLRGQKNISFKSILIIVQTDATQSSLFIILQVHSTCFGCQPHPSSGIHKTVTTASGTGHIFCAATSLQSGQASLEGGICTKNMNSTGGCSYCFVYSWPRWREIATQKKCQYRRL